MVCEICESQSIKKENGVFVCLECGTEYSLDEAKKLLKEIDEELVKNDSKSSSIPEPKQASTVSNTQPNVDTHLQNANRAFTNKDYEEAEKYFNKAEEINPNSIEAIVYSALCRAHLSLAVNDLEKRKTVFHVLKNSILMIPNGYSVDKDDYYRTFLPKLVKDLGILIGSNFYYKQWRNANNVLVNNYNDTIVLFTQITDAITTITNKVIGINPQYYMYKLPFPVYDSLEKVCNQNVRVELIKNRKVYKNSFVNLYWKNNHEQKQEIDAEILEIATKLEEIEREKKKTYEYQEFMHCTNVLEELEKELKSLSVFKVKEKKILKEKIEEAEKNKKEAFEKYNFVLGNYSAICKPLKNRKDELTKSLTSIPESIW